MGMDSFDRTRQALHMCEISVPQPTVELQHADYVSLATSFPLLADVQRLSRCSEQPQVMSIGCAERRHPQTNSQGVPSQATPPYPLPTHKQSLGA